MNQQIAEKIQAAYSKIDKARVWHKNRMSRVYVGKNGRFVEITHNGEVDVTGMVISQARDGAAKICGELGLNVVAK